MMGPGFGYEFWNRLFTIAVLLFLVGIMIGAGCGRGFSWAARHINVEWKP